MHLTEKFKNKTSLQIRKLKFIFGSLILLASLISGSIAMAEYGHYTSGQPVTLGEFVYDDNFQATTTPCVLTVYDPSGTLSASATTTARADGWHYYTLTTSTDVGLWSASISCGSAGAGDLAKIDKSFYIDQATSTTNSFVASSVWNSSGRTLTDYSTSSIASAIWNSSIRTLSSFGTLAGDIWSSATRSLTDYSTSTIATAVWSSPARTLTSFGTLVSDIATAVWGSGSRTLTAFGSLAADVWNNTFASTRRLTDQTLTSGGNLATQADINNATSSIITEVLANRTLINNLNNISAADVWAYGARTLTSAGGGAVDLTASSTLAIWNVAKSSLTSSGSIGKTIADNLDATISSRSTSTLTAADVWLSATRTLSDYATSSLASAVWSNGSRTLTNYGNNITAADVWNVLTSSLTTTGSVGAQVAGTNTSTIASSIWSSATRSLTDYGTTTLASAVWSSPARTLTSFGTLVSDIATAVWGSGSRTLTAFGSLAADVWNNTFASTRRLTDSTLTSGGNIATQSDINNATSSIITEVLANRTLINNLNNISAADVWAYGTRTTTGGSATVDLTASSTLAIWNVAKSSLTSAGSIGKTIADNLDATISSRSTSTLTAADVWLSATRTLSDYSTSSITSAVWANANRTLTNYGNDITAADVWNVLTSSLTTAGSVGAQVAGTNTSTIASSIWSSATRSLTDYSTSTIATAVWSSPARTLTSFGTLVSDIATAVWGSGSRTLTAFGSLAADVWNNTFASTRRLTDSTLTSGGNIATQSDINNATSTIVAEVLANRTLINNLNNISAADVWAYGSKDVTLSNPSQVWNVASSSLSTLGSVGKHLVDNLNTTISSRGTSNLTAADVWLSATRTLSDYATSSLASAIWSNGSRTLTNYGNNITAADVWNVLTSSLTTAGSVGAQVAGLSTTTVASSVWNNGSRIITGQQGAWITTLSDTDSVMTGRSYRAKYYIYNSNSATDPYAAPQITLYDADRNVVVSGVAMTRLSTGVYEYVYSVASGATQGAWETIVSTQVESGRLSENTDYWEVRGAPAQVIIREVNQTQVPDISANVTITNEGTSGYEYTYEWCVVSQSNNSCGGGNDVFYGSAAKFILPGENWDTALTATVPTAGNYYFKLVVYFGAESSGASRSFTATSATVVTPPSGGGGGGGGGNTSPPPVNNPPAKNDKYPTADSNKDGKVDAVDFSIMLFYWKTKPPYANAWVDINKDGKVDAVDFSIMLFQWTGKK